MTTKDFGVLISALVILILSSLVASAQNLIGAWKLVTYNGKPFAEERIKIYSNGYFMFAIHATDGAFVKAGGGNYKANGNEYTEVLDFYTGDSTQVRKPMTYHLSLKNDELTISAKGNCCCVA